MHDGYIATIEIEEGAGSLADQLVPLRIAVLRSPTSSCYFRASTTSACNGASKGPLPKRSVIMAATASVAA